MLIFLVFIITYLFLKGYEILNIIRLSRIQSIPSFSYATNFTNLINSSSTQKVKMFQSIPEILYYHPIVSITAFSR